AHRLPRPLPRRRRAPGAVSRAGRAGAGGGVSGQRDPFVAPGGRMTAAPASPAETVVATMAREIEDGAVIATGVASPLAILAIAVARATHAPRLTYLACVGALDPEIATLHACSEDLEYLDGR